MITITRRAARQVRAVFRRALGLPRGLGPAVSFLTGPDGLYVRARQEGAAVEYHEPGDHQPQELTVPFEFLADCEAGNQKPVRLERDGDSGVTGMWNDGTTQCVRYDAPDTAGEMPALPEVLVTNSPRLLTALHEASGTAAPESRRFALNAIQLQGASGQIAATDGKQLLVASGFEFPWDDDLLVPHSTVFGSREFGRTEEVAIGEADGWVALRVGPWTVWFETMGDARFPKVTGLLPERENAATTVCFAQADAEFLTESLKRLPHDDELIQPVTVDADRTVAIRAQADGQTPTDLVLTNSTVEGQAVRVSTHRAFLARAVKLGFREVHLYVPERRAYCCDDRRSYLWALLDKDDVVEPSGKSVRIESPRVGGESVHNPKKRTSQSNGRGSKRRRRQSRPHRAGQRR